MTSHPSIRTHFEQWLVSPTAIALLIAVGLVTAFTLAVPARDSLAYWTAGHQLVHRSNPYSAETVEGLESAAGFHGSRGSLVMLNPPWALPLALPFGLVDFRLAGLLWALSLLGCLIVSVRMLRIMHGSSLKGLHILGYCFAPAVACVFAGQIPLFALLGLTLFLRLHRTRPYLAGASLYLCAVKPHLFLPFGLVLLDWTLVTRRYKIVAGAAITFVASNILVLLLDPSAWTQYRQFMHAVAPRIADEFIPCWSVVLRHAINPHALWLQGLPEVIGCVWALGYFWMHRRDWDWMEHGALVMLVSLFVAPYTWLIDQSVLIPALLHGLYRTRSRAFAILLGSASALILIQIGLGAAVHSRWNLWPAPFWLVLYLWFTRSAPAANEYAAPPASDEATSLASS
jgi:Glycosyltransferase family 87